MSFWEKLKETGLSVLPITVSALILIFIFGLTGEISVIFFLFSSLLMVLGLSLFLLGVDMGFIPVGNHLGNLITGKRKVWLLLSSGLVLGAMVTFAEPDVRVLASQVKSVDGSVDINLFVLVIALGVGLFMALSYLRALSRFSFKITITLCIGVLCLLSLFLPPFLASVGFDAGGATTGPLAVPFILALGIGVSSVHGNREEDSFGFTGIASIGPVLAVMVYGLFLNKGGSLPPSEESVHSLLSTFISVVKSVSSSLLPLVLLSIITVAIMKLPKVGSIKIGVGILYSYLGIVLFLFSVEASFMPVALAIGSAIASSSPYIVVLTGMILGFAVALAEPAIFVLTGEVEEKSQGRIRRKVLLFSIAFGVAAALGLSMVRIMLDIDYRCLILPIYGIILILLPFVPTLFASIAFDSGGVATGPMTSTFLLPLSSGFAMVVGSGEMAFGMIGLIASMPILALEILGIIYSIKTRGGKNE